MLWCISLSLQRNINGIKIFPLQYWKCVFITVTSTLYQFSLLCKTLTVSQVMVSPNSAPHCCSKLASHPKALHLPSSEQMLSQIPHHWGLQPSFNPGQRERTRMQQTALESSINLTASSSGAALPNCPCAAALQLCPGSGSCVSSVSWPWCHLRTAISVLGLLPLLLWDSSSRGQDEHCEGTRQLNFCLHSEP